MLCSNWISSMWRIIIVIYFVSNASGSFIMSWHWKICSRGQVLEFTCFIKISSINWMRTYGIALSVMCSLWVYILVIVNRISRLAFFPWIIHTKTWINGFPFQTMRLSFIQNYHSLNEFNTTVKWCLRIVNVLDFVLSLTIHFGSYDWYFIILYYLLLCRGKRLQIICFWVLL